MFLEEIGEGKDMKRKAIGGLKEREDRMHVLERLRPAQHI